jgi:Cytochrome P460
MNLRPLLLLALGLLPLSLAAKEGVQIALPDDFRTTMQHYASVDRADGITYRLYVNDMALETWARERRLPSGTIFAIENFLAATDASGAPLRDAADRLVPGESLNDVHVAMKSALWAEDGPQTTTGLLRGAATADGSWRMEGFDPRTGAPTPNLNIAECHQCHLDPRAEDFHLSRGLLDSFVRTGTPAFIAFACAEREICFGTPPERTTP